MCKLAPRLGKTCTGCCSIHSYLLTLFSGCCCYCLPCFRSQGQTLRKKRSLSRGSHLTSQENVSKQEALTSNRSPENMVHGCVCSAVSGSGNTEAQLCGQCRFYERLGNCSYVSRPFINILMTPDAFPISIQVSLPSSVSFPTSLAFFPSFPFAWQEAFPCPIVRRKSSKEANPCISKFFFAKQKESGYSQSPPLF